MKSENKTENDMNDSTKKIVIESKKKNLQDIIQTKWKKKCPKCDKQIEFTSRSALRRSVRKNSLCKTCSNLTYFNPRFTGKKHNENFYKTRPIGEKHHYFGKNLSEECRNKISLTMRLKRQSVYSAANFNPVACEYFNKLNEHNHWNLQHALNGGEVRVIGYSLDAYDRDKNIVVEYDEPKHYLNGKLREKDVLRQQRIIAHLGCKFHRFNERTQKLYEVSYQTAT